MTTQQPPRTSSHNQTGRTMRPRLAWAEQSGLRQHLDARFAGVITAWLLDLTAPALLGQRHLSQFSGRVSAPGEGRWTVPAAIDAGAA